uniref:Uncharacterized protein n=1 Tax=Oryza nivara TaxID=4536 RepID=A0A0E0HQE4_ORYNI
MLRHRADVNPRLQIDVTSPASSVSSASPNLHHCLILPPSASAPADMPTTHRRGLNRTVISCWLLGASSSAAAADLPPLIFFPELAMAELVLELAGGKRRQISACNLRRKCKGVQGEAIGGILASIGHRN